jgi:hypothetical protein
MVAAPQRQSFSESGLIDLNDPDLFQRTSTNVSEQQRTSTPLFFIAVHWRSLMGGSRSCSRESRQSEPSFAASSSKGAGARSDTTLGRNSPANTPSRARLRISAKELSKNTFLQKVRNCQAPITSISRWNDSQKKKRLISPIPRRSNTRNMRINTIGRTVGFYRA